MHAATACRTHRGHPRILKERMVRDRPKASCAVKKDGHEVTHPTVTGICGSSKVPRVTAATCWPDQIAHVYGDFDAPRRFVREIKRAGECLTVIKTQSHRTKRWRWAIDRAAA